jgi:hypothetical protein
LAVARARLTRAEAAMHFPGKRTMQGALRRLVVRPAHDLIDTVGVRRIAQNLRNRVRGPCPQATFSSESGLAVDDWRRLTRSLSETGGAFFSDNLVSNESSYLQPADALRRLPKGMVYVGVGPEQTFSYLALLEPALAVIVDVRRDNARLHFLYKALFEQAASRAEWLSLLLGRPFVSDPILGPDASVDDVVSHVERSLPSAVSFEAAHNKVLGRMQNALGPSLSLREARRIRRMHVGFYRRQLEITFQLKSPSRKTYPTLRQLLVARSPEGRQLGFLSSDHAYQTVRRLHLQHRVLPVVADLTGSHAFAAVADQLRRWQLQVGVLYVSNVEQYVFEERRWDRWIRNLQNLPLAPGAAVLRTYLDQGRSHPEQLAGHRTTNVMQSAQRLLELQRQQGYRSYWELVTDARLSVNAARR